VHAKNSFGKKKEECPLYCHAETSDRPFFKKLIETDKDTKIRHFSGRPSIITAGIQLYETLGEADTGYAGDLRVMNEWVKILNVSDWCTWVGFEDAPESYFADV
jgi:hypothetical protein